MTKQKIEEKKVECEDLAEENRIDREKLILGQMAFYLEQKFAKVIFNSDQRITISRICNTITEEQLKYLSFDRKKLKLIKSAFNDLKELRNENGTYPKVEDYFNEKREELRNMSERHGYLYAIEEALELHDRLCKLKKE